MPGPARVVHLSVTLTGSAQQLTLPQTGGKRTPIRGLGVQPRPAGANPVFLGGPGVTTTDYGVYVPGSVSSIPPAPLIINEMTAGSTDLEDWYIVGTLAEVVSVLVFAYV